MSDELVIVPAATDGFVELARTKTGRLFRKHILNKGSLRHPVTGALIEIDDKFVDTLVANFNAGVCDIVQVPLADDKNRHTEAPDRNIGEVLGIEASGDKVYAVLDVRDEIHAGRIGKTYLGASAMLSPDYVDTKTGAKVGPTLLHTCITNRPYVTGLENYEEIISATSDTTDGAVLLFVQGAVEVAKSPAEESVMSDMVVESVAKPSLEELLTSLKADHGIDVPDLQAKVGESVSAAQLSQTIAEAIASAGVIKLAGDGVSAVSAEDLVGAVAEMAADNVALTGRVHKLERQDAEHEVRDLIKAGRVIPAQLEAFVELRLTNPDMFDRLVPAQPILKLEDESGVIPPDDEAHKKDMDAEIARLSAMV